MFGATFIFENSRNGNRFYSFFWLELDTGLIFQYNKSQLDTSSGVTGTCYFEIYYSYMYIGCLLHHTFSLRYKFVLFCHFLVHFDIAAGRGYHGETKSGFLRVSHRGKRTQWHFGRKFPTLLLYCLFTYSYYRVEATLSLYKWNIKILRIRNTLVNEL